MKFIIFFSCNLSLLCVCIKCVLTCSADATIKLWAIEDFSCIKTFEGHSNSVLKAVFISRGMQIASRYVCVCHAFVSVCVFISK